MAITRSQIARQLLAEGGVSLDDASTKVTVILAPDPAASDIKIDLTTAVLNDGTVYNVVRFVVVRSAFLFIKLFAINLKRS